MPCVAEAPHLQKDIWEAYRTRGLLVVGIDLVEKPEKVKSFKERFGWTFPVLLDPDRKSIPGSKRVAAVAHNILVDRDMVVRYSQLGFDKGELDRAIVELLGQTVPEKPLVVGSPATR